MAAGIAIAGVVIGVISLFANIFGQIRSTFLVSQNDEDYSSKFSAYLKGEYYVKHQKERKYFTGHTLTAWSREYIQNHKDITPKEMYFFNDSLTQTKSVKKKSPVWSAFDQDIFDAMWPPHGYESPKYFSYGSFNNYMYDYNPTVVRLIRSNNLEQPEGSWFFMSFQPKRIMWKPSGWILAPTTGYDYLGNFYYVDDYGKAEMLKAFDSPEPNELYSADSASRYSTFTGASVKSWYDAQATIAQESRAAEAKQAEESAELELQTLKEAEVEQYKANRSLYWRNGAITVGVLTGLYFILKFIKKRKKL